MEQLNIWLAFLEEKLSLGAGNGALWLCLMAALTAGIVIEIGRGRRG